MNGRTPSSVECVRAARKHVSRIRRILLRPSPATLETCLPHLREAINALSQVQRAADTGVNAAATRRALQFEMAQLDRELSHVNALMRTASLLFEGWSRLVFPDEAPEYGRTGCTAAHAMPTVRVEG